MEKRYQVFISSTYQDLIGPRQAVSEALLRTNCFPAGMELFPAADEEQFEFIKSVIDQSDYYMIISAGRYGSIHPQTGLSYTEMEYDYAVQTEKPIIRLLHEDPFSELKGKFLEQSDAAQEKLRAFRGKLKQGSLVKFWTNPEQLMTETVFALQDIQRRKPAIGWVRADEAGKDFEIQNLRLKDKVRKLEAKTKAPKGKNPTAVHLPIVDKCLKKIGKPPTSEDPSYILVPLNDTFGFGSYSKNLLYYLKAHGIATDDAYPLIDALVLDDVLAETADSYKLTPNGKKVLSAFRVTSYLDQPKTLPPPAL